jgi:CO/xanthine dehydrogenase Mo-binding subunit
VTVHSGDTVRAPNEGYTAGSQSIQTGAVALRQACADVRALFLSQAAAIIGCKPDELSVRDGSILRNGASTGQDYWTLAGAIDLTAKATGTGARKAVADFTAIGHETPRLDLPGKIFGDAAFIHDMKLDGMVHARVDRRRSRRRRRGQSRLLAERRSTDAAATGSLLVVATPVGQPRARRAGAG